VNSFYFVDKDNWLLCEIDACTVSERTFDIGFSALAMNRKLLRLLNLCYLESKQSVEWFAGYLSAFSNKDYEAMFDRFLEDPVLRLLVMDNDLLEKVNEILNK
jgi:hypothetical protein